MQPIYPDLTDLPDEDEAYVRKRTHTDYTRPMYHIDGMTSILPETADWEIPSDVMGSYTGTPAEGAEPEQDADDL